MSTATGTAELLQDTVTAVPEAQGENPPAESAPVRAAETDAGQPTETDESTTEAPALRSIEDLSDDELRDHPRFKGEIAKREESQRNRAEHDTARRIAQQNQQFVQQGGLLAAMRQMLTEGIDKGSFNEAQLQRVSDAVYHANTSLNNQAFDSAMASAMTDMPIPEKAKEAIERVQRGVETGRHTMEDLITARFEGFKAAAIEAAKPALRKEIEAEIRKAAMAEGETDSLRQNRAQLTSQTRPSNLRGAAPAARDADAIIGDSSASRADRMRAFQEKHGFSPA